MAEIRHQIAARGADGVVRCFAHNEPAVQFLCNKGKKENIGKKFYKCSRPVTGQCQFFMWEDDPALRMIASSQPAQPMTSSLPGSQRAFPSTPTRSRAVGNANHTRSKDLSPDARAKRLAAITAGISSAPLPAAFPPATAAPSSSPAHKPTASPNRSPGKRPHPGLPGDDDGASASGTLHSDAGTSVRADAKRQRVSSAQEVDSEDEYVDVAADVAIAALAEAEAAAGPPSSPVRASPARASAAASRSTSQSTLSARGPGALLTPQSSPVVRRSAAAVVTDDEIEEVPSDEDEHAIMPGAFGAFGAAARAPSSSPTPFARNASSIYPALTRTPSAGGSGLLTRSTPALASSTGSQPMPAWKLEEIASRLDGDAAVLREHDVHVKRLERRLVAAQRTADARSDESSRLHARLQEVEAENARLHKRNQELEEQLEHLVHG